MSVAGRARELLCCEPRTTLWNGVARHTGEMQADAYWAELEDRLSDWVGRAVRKRPESEPRVAGAVRAAAQHSARVRASLARAAEVFIERRSFGRPLYAAALGALGAFGDRRLGPLLQNALRNDEAGGLPAIAAAAQCGSAALRECLMRVAASRHPHLAFGAAVARGARGEDSAVELVPAAARLNENARIDVCSQLLVPMLLLHGESGASRLELPPSLGPAFRVLRDAERHLGRWLALAQAGLASRDRSGLEEAERRAGEGSPSARAAWALLGWALRPGNDVPAVRPTAEIVARLSDRPTAERDMSFLFRLAAVRADAARGMLESVARAPLRGATAVRAAGALATGWDHRPAVDALRAAADGRRRTDLQGISVAALCDAGVRHEARERAAELCGARNLSCAVWGGLVLRQGSTRGDGKAMLLSEPSFRRLELGWVH
jgi:hypothetical protein